MIILKKSKEEVLEKIRWVIQDHMCQIAGTPMSNLQYVIGDAIIKGFETLLEDAVHDDDVDKVIFNAPTK